MIIISGTSASATSPVNPISLTIGAPTTSEDVSIFYTQTAVTLNRLVVVHTGVTPSTTWTLRWASDRSAAGTEVISGGSTSTSIGSGDIYVVLDNPVIPALSFLWLETSAGSGTRDSFQLTMFFV